MKKVKEFIRRFSFVRYDSRDRGKELQDFSQIVYLMNGVATAKYNYADVATSKQVSSLHSTQRVNTLVNGWIKHKKNKFAKLVDFKTLLLRQNELKKFLIRAYGMDSPFHPWNIVDKSPWPFLMGMSALYFMLGLISFIHGFGPFQLKLGVCLLLFHFILWCKDIVREGTFHGKHTSFVRTCLKTGFKYFIASELMLFVSFFWTFYNFFFNGSVVTSYIYPPLGIGMDDKLPSIMNLILIMSGCIITFGHVHYKLRLNYKHVLSIQHYLIITILFGAIFISFQVYEYCHNSFTFSDSTFGSVFYILTGCHSLHVIVGVCFLSVACVRNFMQHTTFDHNLNYLLAVWYWHFVDVIWVFLYIKIYYVFNYIKLRQDLDFHYIMYDLSGGSMYFNYFELLLQKSLEKFKDLYT